MAIVTIGIPLYNNATTLKRTLDSILCQSEQDFMVILSDDCSTDDTWVICQDFARLDSRVMAVRQTHNRYYLNFLDALQRANTDYFCWLSADDYWGPDFLRLCIHELQADDALISCHTRCQFFYPEGEAPAELAKGTFSIEDHCRETRILKFLEAPMDNSRMYGVFHREALLKSFPPKIFHAYDWALSQLVLCEGAQRELPELQMFRERTPPGGYNKMVNRDARSFLTKYFPLLDMTLYLYKAPTFPRTKKVLAALVYINIDKHLSYLVSERPKTYKIIGPFVNIYNKYIGWRMRPSYLLQP